MTIFTNLGAFEINKAAATDRPSCGIEWSKKPTSPAPRWMVRSDHSISLFRLIEAAKLTGDNSTVFHYTGLVVNSPLAISRARIYIDAKGLLAIMATLTETITYRPGHKRPEKVTAFYGPSVNRAVRLGKK